MAADLTSTPLPANRTSDETVGPPGKPRAVKLPYDAQVISAVFGMAFMGDRLAALPWNAGPDDLERVYGPEIWTQMMNDPTTGSCVDILRQAAIAEPMTFTPAVVDKEGTAKTPDGTEAALCAEFLEMAYNRPARPLVDTINELAYGLVQDKLAEVPLEQLQEGKFAGWWAPQAFNFKPRDAWRYCTDVYGNTDSIAGRVPSGIIPPPGGVFTAASIPGSPGNAVLVDMDRLLNWKWAAQNGDPRGNAIIRRAANGWNLKVRVWPEMLKYLVQFSVPGIVVEGDVAAPDMADAPDGAVNPDNSPMTPEDYVLACVKAWRAGSGLVLQRGWKAKILESARNAEGIIQAIDMFNREIGAAILHTATGTQEARHASKALGEVGQDYTGVLVRFIQRSLAGQFQRHARYLIRINRGIDSAERLCPSVSLGKTEHQDRATIITAVANLVRAKYFAPSQLQALDAEMGFTVREQSEIELARKQAENAANPPEPVDAGGADDGKGSGNKPPVKKKAA